MSGTVLRIRPSNLSDAEWATAIYNAANPDDPHELAFTQWIWAIEDAEWQERRFAIELDRVPMGWTTVEHIVWSKSQGRRSES